MPYNENFRKRYFSDAAWTRLKELRKSRSEKEEEVFASWLELLQEGGTLLGQDPRREKVQDWAAQCHEAWENSTAGDPTIQAGYNNALRDHRNWPAEARRPIVSLDLEKVLEFVRKAQACRRMGYHDRWTRLRKLSAR